MVSAYWIADDIEAMLIGTNPEVIEAMAQGGQYEDGVMHNRVVSTEVSTVHKVYLFFF